MAALRSRADAGGANRSGGRASLAEDRVDDSACARSTSAGLPRPRPTAAETRSPAPLRRAKNDAVATTERRPASGRFSPSSKRKPNASHRAICSPRARSSRSGNSTSWCRSWKTGLKGGRNFERGRQLYSAVACAACHRFVNEGGSVGPDLTGVVGRYSVRDLLESIVEPNKVISDQYQAIIIHTADGRVVTGRVGNLSAANMNVVEDMFDPGRMTSVRRADIESMEPSPVSMMPQGLLNSLNAEEIQDLLAYLLSRGDSEHPAYR